MKVKLQKQRHHYELLVDDAAINDKYHSKKPIVLAVLETWEGTQCWSLTDLRLCSVIYPSPYLGGNNTQTFTPKNTEEEMWLISTLKIYEKQDDTFVWPTFDGIVAFGDKSNDNNSEYVRRSLQGCWSFKEGSKKMQEIKTFWQNFEGDDLASAKMVNPYFQPNASYFSSLSSVLAMNALPREEIIATWHSINGLGEEFKLMDITNAPKLK